MRFHDFIRKFYAVMKSIVIDEAQGLQLDPTLYKLM